MTTSPLYCNEIDVSKITLGTTKNTKTFINYDNQGSLKIQTPIVYLPYLIKDKKTKDGRVFMKSLALSFLFLLESDEFKMNKNHIKKFIKTINEIDDFIYNLVKPNEDVQFYRSIYKKEIFNTDIKLPYNSTTPIIELYDENRKLIPFNESLIHKKNVHCILKLEGVWISNNKMGISWILEQIKFV